MQCLCIFVKWASSSSPILWPRPKRSVLEQAGSSGSLIGYLTTGTLYVVCIECTWGECTWDLPFRQDISDQPWMRGRNGTLTQEGSTSPLGLVSSLASWCLPNSQAVSLFLTPFFPKSMLGCAALSPKKSMGPFVDGDYMSQDALLQYS